jgi:hypothetical protein
VSCDEFSLAFLRCSTDGLAHGVVEGRDRRKRANLECRFRDPRCMLEDIRQRSDEGPPGAGI